MKDPIAYQMVSVSDNPVVSTGHPMTEFEEALKYVESGGILVNDLGEEYDEDILRYFANADGSGE